MAARHVVGRRDDPVGRKRTRGTVESKDIPVAYAIRAEEGACRGAGEGEGSGEIKGEQGP